MQVGVHFFKTLVCLVLYLVKSKIISTTLYDELVLQPAQKPEVQLTLKLSIFIISKFLFIEIISTYCPSISWLNACSVVLQDTTDGKSHWHMIDKASGEVDTESWLAGYKICARNTEETGIKFSSQNMQL